MEINLNANVGSIARATAVPPESRPTPSAADAVSFDKSQALNQSLDSVTTARPDVVERAKQLVSSSSYPPPEVIRRISVLLALKMSDGSTHESA